MKFLFQSGKLFPLVVQQVQAEFRLHGIKERSLPGSRRGTQSAVQLALGLNGLPLHVRRCPVPLQWGQVSMLMEIAEDPVR